MPSLHKLEVSLLPLASKHMQKKLHKYKKSRQRLIRDLTSQSELQFCSFKQFASMRSCLLERPPKQLFSAFNFHSLAGTSTCHPIVLMSGSLLWPHPSLVCRFNITYLHPLKMGIWVYIAKVLILAPRHPSVTMGLRKFPSLSWIENHYFSKSSG